jgi:hypothetical protein
MPIRKMSGGTAVTTALARRSISGIVTGRTSACVVVVVSALAGALVGVPGAREVVLKVAVA